MGFWKSYISFNKLSIHCDLFKYLLLKALNPYHEFYYYQTTGV